jgi:SAM-dependent methyltransferase
MTSGRRWQKAQEYELGFWEEVARNAASGSLREIAFYEWRAGKLMERLERLGLTALLDGDARIVELGSGPVGVVGSLPARVRVAVDPLNGAYAERPEFEALRSPEVRYLEAPGEAVPLEAGHFDLVIMENCIDHVRDVDAVMREIVRLLGSSGVLYMTVNARSRPGYFVHRVLARLALDPGHPHTFTRRRFQQLLRHHGFEVLEDEATSWWEAWWKDLRGPGLRTRLKGLLFVSEHLLVAVARKGTG